MNGGRRSVRTLPMRYDDPEFKAKGWTTAEQIQDNFFLQMLGNTGIYQFPTKKIDEDGGTIVLFQLDSHVIASAELAERPIMYESPKKDQYGGVYKGEYRFVPDSIKVFDPVDAEVVASVWAGFRRFGNVSYKLAVEHYSDFESRLSNVRTPLFELAADDADNDDYVLRCGDERPIIMQQIRARRGGRRFREGLLARFNATCLVTGCRIKDLLEAAHICPHRGTKDDHLQNGLLLRSDIHTLFDLHLLGIEPEQLRVDIHPKLKEDEYYRDLDGKLLAVTSEARPSVTSLREHYDKFRRRIANP